MKKLLLLAAGLLVSMTGFAATYKVVGAYSEPSWNFDASVELTGTGDELSCTIASLTSDFKIVNTDVASWADQYGTSEKIELGKPYILSAKNGGPDPSNITFGNHILSVSNATVTFNTTTLALTVTGTPVFGYPTLYVTGSFCGWNEPGTGASVECSENNGIYTAEVNLGDSGNVEFKLAGSGWSNEIAGGVEVGNETAVKVTEGGANLKTTLTGEQTLTFNYNNMAMTFGDPSLVEEDPVEPEPTPTVWAVVGSYTTPNWDFEASTKLTGEGETLSCTIDYLVNDFKIVDISNNNWDTAYGSSEAISVNKAATLTLGGGNINFGGMIQGVKNATVTWNPTTASLTVSAQESDIVTGYPTLYLTGGFNGWTAPGEAGSLLCAESNGQYTVTVDLGNSGDIEFKLAGSGWSNEIGGTGEDGTTVVGEDAVQVYKGGSNLKTTLTGTWTLNFDYDKTQMWFSDGEESDEPTPPTAANWGIVGAFSNPAWNFSEAIDLTYNEETKLWSATVESLTTSFKVVDLNNTDWSVQYGLGGSNEYLPLNTLTKLTPKGDEDPLNIIFPFNVASVKNATINWNPQTAELQVVVADAGIVEGYPTLVVTGGFNEWKLETDAGAVECEEEKGIYTVTFTLPELAEGQEYNEFKLSGENWQYNVGGYEVNDTESTLAVLGGSNFKTTLTGEQTLTFNYNTMAVTFGDPSLTEETPEAPEPAPAVWAVVGAYTEPNWNFSASVKLTGEGETLSCTIDYLVNDFKIVDIANNNWDTAYGSSAAISVNKAATLTLDGDNIKFEGLIQGVKNATVTWNPTTASLTVSAKESDIVIGYPVLYFTGSVTDWSAPGQGTSVLGKENDGVYTFAVDLGETGDVEFKLAGTGWSNEIAGGVEIGTEPTEVTQGGKNLYTTLTGAQTLVFNYDNMSMYFMSEGSGDEPGTDEPGTDEPGTDEPGTDEPGDGPGSGVESLENDAELIIYNLQGVRVDSNKLTRGIYVINGKKVLVK